MTDIMPLRFTAEIASVQALLDLREETSKEKVARLISLLDSNLYTSVAEGVLRRLVDYYPAHLTSGLLQGIAPPHLRELRLKRCQNISASGLLEVLKKCQKLQALNLSECDQLMVPSLFRMYSKMTSVILTAVSLENCQTLSDDVVKCLLWSIPSLKHLNISSCNSITDKVFLLNEELQLRREACTLTFEDEPPEFECSLVSVDLSGCRGISSSAIRHLTTLCGPSLRSVNIAWTEVDCIALLYLCGYSLPAAVQFAISADSKQSYTKLQEYMEEFNCLTKSCKQTSQIWNDKRKDFLTEDTSACSIVKVDEMIHDGGGQDKTENPVMSGEVFKQMNDRSAFLSADGQNPGETVITVAEKNQEQITLISKTFVSCTGGQANDTQNNAVETKTTHSFEVQSQKDQTERISHHLFFSSDLSEQGASSVIQPVYNNFFPDSPGAVVQTAKDDCAARNPLKSDAFCCQTGGTTLPNFGAVEVEENSLSLSNSEADEPFICPNNIVPGVKTADLDGCHSFEAISNPVHCLLQAESSDDSVNPISGTERTNLRESGNNCGKFLVSHTDSTKKNSSTSNLTKSNFPKDVSKSKSLNQYSKLYTPNITAIDISNIYFHNVRIGHLCLKEFLTANGDIQKLGLSWKHLSDKTVDVIGQFGCELRELSFLDCDSLTSFGVASIAVNCKKLKKVDLKGVCFIGDTAVVPLILNKNLVSLTLSESDITDSTLCRISKIASSRLTELDLSWCEEITEKGVNAISSSCSNLHSLNLRQCPVSDLTLSLIAKHCRKLQNVVLSCVGGITDISVVNLVRNLHLLEEIDLSWNSDLTDSSILALFESCSFLRSAILSGIKRLSSAPFLPIISGLKKWRRSQALLRFKLHERNILEENGDLQYSSDEEFAELYLPYRSTSYAPSLQNLDLSYCDKVNDDYLSEIVAVCRGSLTVIDYYNEAVNPSLITARKGKVFLPPE